MSVFVVMLPGKNSEVLNRLSEKYPNFHELNPTSFVLVSNDLSTQVADGLGLKGEKRVSPGGGVVLKLNGSYAGHADPSVWEWLEGEEGSF